MTKDSHVERQRAHLDEDRPDQIRRPLADMLLTRLQKIREQREDTDAETLQREIVRLKDEPVPEPLIERALQKLSEYTTTRAEAEDLRAQVHRGHFVAEIAQEKYKLLKGAGQLLFNKYTKWPIVFGLGALAGPSIASAIGEIPATAGAIHDAIPNQPIPISAQDALRAGTMIGGGALATGLLVGGTGVAAVMSRKAHQHEEDVEIAERIRRSGEQNDPQPRNDRRQSDA